jgi:hypothetical protein
MTDFNTVCNFVGKSAIYGWRNAFGSGMNSVSPGTLA